MRKPLLIKAGMMMKRRGRGTHRVKRAWAAAGHKARHGGAGLKSSATSIMQQARAWGFGGASGLRIPDLVPGVPQLQHLRAPHSDMQLIQLQKKFC